MKKKKKSAKGLNKFSEFDNAEDREELLAMNRDELAEVGAELDEEAQHSQAEALAKKILKMEPLAQEEALKNLRRQDMFLFETVEYLMPRMKRK